MRIASDWKLEWITNWKEGKTNINQILTRGFIIHSWSNQLLQINKLQVEMKLTATLMSFPRQNIHEILDENEFTGNLTYVQNFWAGKADSNRFCSSQLSLCLCQFSTSAAQLIGSCITGGQEKTTTENKKGQMKAATYLLHCQEPFSLSSKLVLGFL